MFKKLIRFIQGRLTYRKAIRQYKTKKLVILFRKDDPTMREPYLLYPTRDRFMIARFDLIADSADYKKLLNREISITIDCYTGLNYLPFTKAVAHTYLVTNHPEIVALHEVLRKTHRYEIQPLQKRMQEIEGQTMLLEEVIRSIIKGLEKEREESTKLTKQIKRRTNGTKSKQSDANREFRKSTGNPNNNKR